MRGSAKCILLTVAAGALQLFPPTSVFLTYLGGLFYFGALLNLSAAVLTFEVILGRSHRALLILPVVFYSGYALYAAVSHREADRINRQATTSNSLVRVKWDRAKQSPMLMSGNATGEGDILSGEQLVEHFDIGAVYAAPRSTQNDPTLVEVQERPCPSDTLGQIDSGDRVLYRRPVRGGYPQPGPLKLATNLCVVIGSALTPPRPLLVSIREEEWQSPKLGLVSHSSLRIWIKAPDQPVATLHYGRFEPVTWFPMPLIGCVVGGAGGVGCYQSLLYEQSFEPVSFSNPSSDSPTALVARALRIARKPLWDRYPRSEWKPR